MSTTDLTLLQRWTTAGDPEAFREIVSRYAAMVYATCRRVLGSTPEAEEAARECFQQLAQGGAGPNTHVGTWLHTVATSRALGRFRGEQRRTEPVGAARGVGAEIEWNDVAGSIDEAIVGLPVRLRVPVVAHFLEDESHVAIAQSLALPRETVSYRIRKAIDLICKLLRKRGISIASSSLSAMMGTNLVQAVPVPATLMAVLEQMAMAGLSTSAEVPDTVVVDMAVARGGGVTWHRLVLGVGLLFVVIIGAWLGAQSSPPTSPDLSQGDVPQLEQAQEGTTSSVSEPATLMGPGVVGRARRSPGARPPQTSGVRATREVRVSPVPGGPFAIEGQVVRVDSGTPVSEFRIGYLEGAHRDLAAVAAARWPALEYVNDSAGRFRLDVAGGGAIATVVAAAPGLVTGTQVVPGARSGETASGITVRLVPAVVEGRVETGTGRPVPDALILVTPFDLPPQPTDAVSRSGPGGLFQLASLPAGVGMIGAYHRDYAPGLAMAPRVSFRPGRVTIVLPVGGSIEGQITYQGQPLVNQEVTVDYSLVSSVVGRSRAVTGADGAYRITGLPEGGPVVSVRPRYRDDTVDQLAVVEDGKVTVVDFNFEENAVVEGSVFLDGRPLAQAGIDVTVVTHDGMTQEFQTETRSDGYYVIESLPAGSVTLKVVQGEEDDWKAIVRTFEVADGEVTRHDIDISGRGGTLVCRVVGAGRREIFYTVVLQGEVSLSEFDSEFWYRIAALKVAEPSLGRDGTFRLEGLEPGSYTVFSSALDEGIDRADGPEFMANAIYGTAVVAVREGEEVSVDLVLQ